MRRSVRVGVGGGLALLVLAGCQTAPVSTALPTTPDLLVRPVWSRLCATSPKQAGDAISPQEWQDTIAVGYRSQSVEALNAQCAELRGRDWLTTGTR